MVAAECARGDIDRRSLGEAWAAVTLSSVHRAVSGLSPGEEGLADARNTWRRRRRPLSTREAGSCEASWAAAGKKDERLNGDYKVIKVDKLIMARER